MRKTFVLASSTLVMAALVLALVLIHSAEAKVLLNEKIPFSELINVPCIGGEISLAGTIHTVYSETEDGTGGKHTRYRFRFHYTGLVTSGPYTGAVYRGSSSEEYNENAKSGDVKTEMHKVTTRLIGKGKAPNLIAEETYKLTVNANGVVIVDRYDLKVKCK